MNDGRQRARPGDAGERPDAGSRDGEVGTDGGPDGGVVSIVTDPVTDALTRFDRFQRGFVATSFVFAVIRKFMDDRAGRLAALVAYYSFFSLFPLMLALTTILGYVLQGNESLQAEVVDSVIAQFPVIGDQIQQEVGSLRGDAVALAVGIAGALWAGLAAMNAAQDAMNDIWDVPLGDRPNFLFRRMRAVLMLAVLGVGIAGATTVNNIANQIAVGAAAKAGLFAGNFVLNVVTLGLAFQVLTDLPLRTRQILPGAIVGAGAYLGLQTAGNVLVQRSLESSETYGAFAVVLGLLTWLYLVAQVTLFAAEINVVASRGLWPRVFVGNDPPTAADVEAAVAQVRSAKRGEIVSVGVGEQQERPPR